MLILLATVLIITVRTFSCHCLKPPQDLSRDGQFYSSYSRFTHLQKINKAALIAVNKAQRHIYSFTQFTHYA